MKTVAIISQKGGSGKTTIAVHLAVCAELSKKRAAIIDLDPQASALEWHTRRESPLSGGHHGHTGTVTRRCSNRPPRMARRLPLSTPRPIPTAPRSPPPIWPTLF